MGAKTFVAQEVYSVNLSLVLRVGTDETTKHTTHHANSDSGVALLVDCSGRGGRDSSLW